MPIRHTSLSSRVKKIAKCLISVTHENGDCNMMIVQVPTIHAEDAR